ncbi:hypothetical protein Taro_027596, partial [Colocasia esculenta]|nr:hypothetical protein [Colocasia esculenta]
MRQVLCRYGLENRAYRAVAFSGPAPESEREKDSTLNCCPGLELKELGLKVGPAFSPRIPLLLGLLSSSSKPQQRVRADHGEVLGTIALDFLSWLGPSVMLKGRFLPLIGLADDGSDVQRFGVILGYNQLVDHVGIYGQRRLTEALNKDSLVRQKEYPTE